MKKAILIFILAFTVAGTYAQNDDPYAIFGHKSAVKYESKVRDFLYIKNTDTCSDIKAIALDAGSGKIFLLGTDDCVIQSLDAEPTDILTWVSVDPKADKYPSLSPYAFCNNNPVKFKDPDGRQVVPANADAAKVIANHLNQTLGSELGGLLNQRIEHMMLDGGNTSLMNKQQLKAFNKEEKQIQAAMSNLPKNQRLQAQEYYEAISSTNRINNVFVVRDPVFETKSLSENTYITGMLNLNVNDRSYNVDMGRMQSLPVGDFTVPMVAQGYLGKQTFTTVRIPFSNNGSSDEKPIIQNNISNAIKGEIKFQNVSSASDY